MFLVDLGTTSDVDSFLNTVKIPVNFGTFNSSKLNRFMLFISFILDVQLVVDMLSMGCLGIGNFMTKSVAKLFCLALYAAVDYIYTKFKIKQYARKTKTKSAMTQDADVISELESEREQKQKLKNLRMVGRINLALFFVYPSICQSVFLGMDCVYISGSEYLSSDFSINCGTNEIYKLFRGFNWVVMIMFVFGVPAFYSSILFQNRRAFLSEEIHEDIEDKLLFLTKQYATNYFYYELIVITRKLLLVGVLSLVPKTSIVQLYVGLLLATYFLATIAWLKPYRSQAINFFAMFCELFMVSYFAMTITARLNGEVNDYFFNQSIYLTIYFYIKVAIAIIVTIFALKMRTHELDTNEDGTTDMEDIEL